MSDLASPLDSLRWLRTAETLPGARLPWLHQRRQAAREQMSRLDWPERREEAWRYTSLEPLKGHTFLPASGDPPTLDLDSIQSRFGIAADHHRLVFVNGRLAPELSRIEDLPPGVFLGGLREALESDPAALEADLGRLSGPGDNLFAAANTASMADGAWIRLDSDVQLERPIELLSLSAPTGEPLIAQPRLLVQLGAGAQATLVEGFAGLGSGLAFTNVISEIVLGEGARLSHQRLQHESPQAFHLAALYLELAARSDYQCVTSSLGAAWSRTEFHLDFVGEGAGSRINGLFMAGDRALTDVHLDIRHLVPGCRSEERFKGILDGRGVAVFDGRILVAQEAQKTQAHLSNANLLLSRLAEVDTKPQLEIYADDVQCGHGTSVGQLEPEAIFYLRSRGIDAAEARKILCLGFAGEILEGYAIPQLRERAEDILRNRLDKIETSPTNTPPPSHP